jgi:hypothetical protein
MIEKALTAPAPLLQPHLWPPLPPFERLDEGFAAFMRLPAEEQRQQLMMLRGTDRYLQVLNEHLGVVSAYLFSYHDSPLYLATDDAFEIDLQRAKIVLEREVLDHWLPVTSIRHDLDHEGAVAALTSLAFENPGIEHPLFDYLEHEASPEAMKIFLRNEVCRNEVVDDEIAVTSTGLQGAMKVTVCANLWDEVGRGRLDGFHTYWLRRLVDAFDDWNSLLAYRAKEKPWFTMITTNVFNVLLTRPGLKFRRFGWFALNEAWVARHFAKILRGIARVGLGNSDDIAIYFSAHESIDPRHTRELLDAFQAQVPRLSDAEATEVVRGAHMSLAASLEQYDRVLGYMRDLSPVPPTQGARP